MIDRVILVDANIQIYRYYYALPKSITDSDGNIVNVICGFCRMLTGLLTEYRNTNTALAIIFDQGSSFRKKIDNNYKAQRKKAPEDLLKQKKFIMENMHQFDLSIISKQDYEADDLIATYATQAQNLNVPATIISTDKDLLQLVNGNNRVHNPTTKKTYDPQAVLEKMLVHPHQISEMLALVGDNVDNIMGIESLSTAEAISILQNYGSIENLLQNIAQLPPVIREKISNNQDLIRHNLQLTSLKSNLDLEVPLTQLSKIKTFNAQALYDLCHKYRFHNIIRTLDRIL